ncbi:MAG: flagellar basal-body rod protein FlgF [Bacillota bacterium]|nr:flagellar basal-body rod protein FlgF [Bacillota bacterium]
MIRALYTSADGMLTQSKRMDVVTNNITNMDTAGYKSEELLSRSFEDLLINRINDPATGSLSTVGQINNGAHIDQVNIRFEQGPLEETKNNTDIALEGDGFFAIQAPAGERYTRAGNFSVNNNGFLVTSEGNYVLGQNGPINVGNTNFTVDKNGTVNSQNGTYQLRIVSFADNGALYKEGSGLYSNNGGSAIIPSSCQVKQGFLEKSNVDVAKETVNMIQISRNYETNQRIIQMLDNSLGKAVNDIAKV